MSPSKCDVCKGAVVVEFFDRRETMGVHCAKCNTFRTFVNVQGQWKEREPMTATEFKDIKESVPRHSLR